MWDAEKARGVSGQVGEACPAWFLEDQEVRWAKEKRRARPKASLGSFRVGTGAAVTELAIRAMVCDPRTRQAKGMSEDTMGFCASTAA